MSEALEEGVVSEPDAVDEFPRRIRAGTDGTSGLVDDLLELSDGGCCFEVRLRR